MAEKRMIAKSVIETDAFYDLSHVTQALYMHLIMGADDDGLLASVRGILRLGQFEEKNLIELEEQGFIIRFPTGVTAIKHWYVCNYIKSDRYHPSLLPEKELLILDEKTKMYNIRDGTKSEPSRNRDGTDVEPQIRVEKNNIGKNKQGEYEGGRLPPLPQIPSIYDPDKEEALAQKKALLLKQADMIESQESYKSV